MGRAVALAGSREVRARIKPCASTVDTAALGQGFLQVLRFPLANYSTAAPQLSSSIIRRWYKRPINGLGCTQHHSARAKEEQQRQVWRHGTDVSYKQPTHAI
jgi:hypothetical protein